MAFTMTVGGVAVAAAGGAGNGDSNTTAAATSGDTRSSDAKAADSKAADSKAADTKAADTKAADTKAADSTAADSTGRSDAGTKSTGSTSRDSSGATKSSTGTADKSSSTAGSHQTSGTAGTSGDPTQPQPLSGADQNTGGANGQCPGGPYCSTRDGSASMNGNGGGLSTGKPCAGCVGKADNKNPKGQMPDASDNNAGYECDTNHGIARGNPAHTACVSPPEECVPEPGEDEFCNPIDVCVPEPGEDEFCNPIDVCVPEPGEDEFCNPINPPRCIPGPGEDENCLLGEEVGKPRPPTTLLGKEAGVPPAGVHAMVSPAAGVLPNTGADGAAGLLAMVGVALVVAGVGVMRWRSTTI